MKENKEINALLKLIDDPDEEVYQSVSEKIAEYGNGIIPNLEDLWENTPSLDVQQRIEFLIHQLHYSDITAQFGDWSRRAHHDLLTGALLTARYQYPELVAAPILQEIEKIKRTVWLELNNYLTPLEQANVVNNILFNYYHLKSVPMEYNHPDDFLVNKVLEYKKGNALSNGILYQVLCDLLDINAKIISIPNQVIIAFYRFDYNDKNIRDPQDKIQFFIDGASGFAYSKQDITNYLKRVDLANDTAVYQPLHSKKIIQNLLKEFSKCFTTSASQYKQNELLALAGLLDE
jgi:Uncharacterized conserved protein